MFRRGSKKPQGEKVRAIDRGGLQTVGRPGAPTPEKQAKAKARHIAEDRDARRIQEIRATDSRIPVGIARDLFSKRQGALTFYNNLDRREQAKYLKDVGRFMRETKRDNESFTPAQAEKVGRTGVMNLRKGVKN